MDTTEIRTWGDLAARAAERFGDKTALVFPDARWTFTELFDESVRVARGLRALGVGRGDKVGLWMQNAPEMLFAMLGTAMIGGIVIPFNNRLRRAEIGQLIAHAGPTVVLVNDVALPQVDFAQMLTDALPGLADSDAERPLDLPEHPTVRRAVLYGERRLPGFLSHDAFHASADAVPPEEVHSHRPGVRARDVALVLYTSGTTAAPKGALITHEALSRAGSDFVPRIKLASDDVIWCPMPLFHISSINPFDHCLWTGATFVSMTIPHPDVLWDQIVDEGATILWPTFEPITQMVFFHPKFSAEALSKVRLCIHVGPREQRVEFESMLPNAKQIAAYGLSEACGGLLTSSPDDPYEVRMDGAESGLPGIELRVVDADGNDVEPDTEGELLFRAPQQFEGYHDDPEQTAAAIDEDGWVHTGDLLLKRSDGYYLYRGRLKDMIKVGGENVGAAEIESYLMRHPAVEVVQVVAAPDARLGQVPVAFVQLRPDADFDPEDIIGFCRGQIASFKVPRRVIPVDEWPMSGTKIMKAKLRERLAEEYAATKGVAQPT